MSPVRSGYTLKRYISLAARQCHQIGSNLTEPPVVKGGTSHGATDPFGRRAEENPTTVWDFYATVLDILGYDHPQVTWHHHGLDRHLTDVHGYVIRDIQDRQKRNRE